MTRHLALDGDLNGHYIDATTAAAYDYELIDWTATEKAYLHVLTVADEFDPEGIPLEIKAEIERDLG